MSDRPIVIRGGSVQIEFNSDVYMPVAADRNKFVGTARVADDLIILRNNTRRIPLLRGGRFKITVHTEIGAGEDSPITIEGTLSGGPLGNFTLTISFNTDVYTDRTQSQTMKLFRHDTRKVRSVNVQYLDLGASITTPKQADTFVTTLELDNP